MLFFASPFLVWQTYSSSYAGDLSDDNTPGVHVETEPSETAQPFITLCYALCKAM